MITIRNQCIISCFAVFVVGSIEPSVAQEIGQEIVFSPIQRDVPNQAGRYNVVSVARFYRDGAATKIETRIKITGFQAAMDAWVQTSHFGDDCGERFSGAWARTEAQPPYIHVVGELNVQRWLCMRGTLPKVSGFPPRIEMEERILGKTVVSTDVKQVCVEFHFGIAAGSLELAADRDCGATPPVAAEFREHLRAGARGAFRQIFGEHGLTALLPDQALQFQPVFSQAVVQESQESELAILVTGALIHEPDRAFKVLFELGRRR